MARLWPVLAIAAAALAAWVLLSEGDHRDGTLHGDEEVVGYDEQGNPILRTAGARPPPKRATSPQSTPEEIERREAERRRSEQVLFLKGIVVAQEGGTPIAGAHLWGEWAGEPCPRLPRRSWAAAEDSGELSPPPFDRDKPWIATLRPAQVTTGSDGRFEWTIAAGNGHLVGRAPGIDIFASAPRFVTAVLCKPVRGGDVTIRLQRALQLPVRVTDLHGRPVEAAQLKIVPAEGTPAEPGHAGQAASDKNGRAEIDGLLPGDVMLRVDHPEFMPQTVGPLDPARGDEVEVGLAPAFRVTFEIRSDDARAIKDPILAWETDGNPPHKGLTLLKATPKGPPTEPLSEVHTEVVRIPCDHRNVRFTLKADGFEPWSPEPEPLPVTGGKRTLIVSLRRDASLASLRIRFQDGKGKPVAYHGMQPVPSIGRLDHVAIPAGIKLETGATLDFPSLPAGPYRIEVSSPKYGPAAVEVTVVAGEENEAVVRLAPPAKLRIRFNAPERLTLRFRVLQEGRVVSAFPEGGSGAPDGAGDRRLVAQGNEGTLVTGLPAGTVTIEVISPELVAAPRTVRLRAGETTDAEMDVRRR